jgi:hypothetical protein
MEGKVNPRACSLLSMVMILQRVDTRIPPRCLCPVYFDHSFIDQAA